MNLILTPDGFIPLDEPAIMVTQTEYNALSEDEKKKEKYYITNDEGKPVNGFIGDSNISSVGNTVTDSIIQLKNQISQLQSTITQLNTSLSSISETVSTNEIFTNSYVNDATSLNNNYSELSSRVDELSTLRNGSTTGDAELMNLRVKYNGSVAVNAGTAVREQIRDITNHLGKSFEYINLLNPLYLKENTALETSSNSQYEELEDSNYISYIEPIHISGGESIYITSKSGSDIPDFTFVGYNLNNLVEYDVTISSGDNPERGYIIDSNASNVTYYKIMIRSDDIDNIVEDICLSRRKGYYNHGITTFDYDIDQYKQKIDNDLLPFKNSLINSLMNTMVYKQSDYTEHQCQFDMAVNPSNGELYDDGMANSIPLNYIAIHPNVTYKLHIAYGDPDAGYALYDENHNFTRGFNFSSNVTDYTFIANSNERFLMFTLVGDWNDIYVTSIMSVNELTTYIDREISDLKTYLLGQIKS